jgi:hypothetical protein
LRHCFGVRQYHARFCRAKYAWGDDKLGAFTNSIARSDNSAQRGPGANRDPGTQCDNHCAQRDHGTHSADRTNK